MLRVKGQQAIVSGGRVVRAGGLNDYGPPSALYDFTSQTSLTAYGITFTRGSAATHFDSTGTLQTVTGNTPRFDYNPSTLSALGLLIEQARTNLLLNSLADGTGLSTQNVTVSATAYTVSFYGTGSIKLSGVASATVSSAGASPTRTTYTFTPTAGTLTCTVSGEVKWAQIEAGAFATSFIPTAESPATRNADVATVTLGSWYNASEGTLFVEVNCPNATSNQYFASLDTSGATRMSLYNNAGAGYWFVRDVSVTQAGVSVGTITSNQTAKLAGAYIANSFNLGVNGSIGTEDTSGTVPAVTTLFIGAYTVGNFINGYVRRIAYYPRRLPDAYLQSLTA